MIMRISQNIVSFQICLKKRERVIMNIDITAINLEVLFIILGVFIYIWIYFCEFWNGLFMYFVL